MSISQFTDRIMLEWKNDTPYDPLKANHDISEESRVKSGDDRFIKCLNKENMSEELKIALQACDAIYNSKGKLNLKRGHIDSIEKWIKKNYPEILPTTRNRIAKVVNINKAGGAPSVEYI